jgi:hypothetical protein
VQTPLKKRKERKRKQWVDNESYMTEIALE